MKREKKKHIQINSIRKQQIKERIFVLEMVKYIVEWRKYCTTAFFPFNVFKEDFIYGTTKRSAVCSFPNTPF